jgi:Uma2 family endonuclease
MEKSEQGEVTETSMPRAAQRKPSSLSIDAFRAWTETRPDEERWELIDGVPVMMTPPTKAHQRIASNLERLLNDPLVRSAAERAAYQRVGLNLGPIVDNYDPEPDVVVIDVEEGSDERYADRFYLIAEVVSASDRPKIEGKREIYKLHKSCNCILTIRQDRFEVRVDARAGSSWTTKVLTGPADELVLTEFGLRCTLADLYRGTPLQARSAG